MWSEEMRMRHFAQSLWSKEQNLMVPLLFFPPLSNGRKKSRNQFAEILLKGFQNHSLPLCHRGTYFW